MAILPERSLILLVAANPEQLVGFYVDGLGFQIMQQIPNYTELALGNFTLAVSDVLFMEGLLGVNFDLGNVQRFVISIHTDAVDADMAKLVNIGAKLIVPPTDQPWRQRICYISDPEGNIIELAQAIPIATN